MLNDKIYDSNKKIANDEGMKGELYATLTARFRLVEQDKDSLQRRFYIYDRYLAGKQDPDVLTLSPLYNTASKKITNSARPVSNFLLEDFEVVLGKLVKYTPKPIVRATGKEPKDRDAAEYADLLVNHKYREDKDKVLQTAFLRDALKYGTGVKKLLWNKLGGRRFPKPGEEIGEPEFKTTVKATVCLDCKLKIDGEEEVTKCPRCNNVDNFEQETDTEEIENKIETTEWAYPGDTETEIVSIKHIYLDPMHRYHKEGNWMYEQHFRTGFWIEAQYGVKLEDDEIRTMAKDSKYSINEDTTNDELLRLTYPILDYYHKPDTNFPNGAFIVMTGTKVVHWDVEEGIPFNDDDYAEKSFPFVFGYYRPHTERPYGEGLIEAGISLQNQINTTDYHIMQFRKVGIIPKILTNERHHLKTELINGDTIEEMKYKSVDSFNRVIQPPTFINPPELSKTFFIDKADNRNAMKEIQNTHNIMEGQHESGSGRALNIKLENAEDRLRPDLDQLEIAETDYHTKKLIGLQKYGNEEMLATMTGDDGKVKTEKFMKADLEGNWKVHVDLGNSLSRSFSLWFANGLDMTDRMFIDPTDLYVRMEFLRRAGMESLIPDIGVDIKKAERENEDIKQDKPVQVDDFEEHQVHMKEHRKLYNSEYMEKEEFAEQKQKLRHHMEEHNFKIEKKRNQEIQMQQAMSQKQPPAGGGGGMPTGNGQMPLQELTDQNRAEPPLQGEQMTGSPPLQAEAIRQ